MIKFDDDNDKSPYVNTFSMKAQYFILQLRDQSFNDPIIQSDHRKLI